VIAAGVAFMVFAPNATSTLWTVPEAPPALHSYAGFRLCEGPVRRTCVVDGDTLWLDGTKIRIADIDTPETHEPRCAAEAERGRRATERLKDWLNAGPFDVVAASDGYADRYGRKLRILARGGRSVGDTLIAEGLAHPWDGARHGWCG
jgi:micrococcal nuclease